MFVLLEKYSPNHTQSVITLSWRNDDCVI